MSLKKEQVVNLSFEAIGTHWVITLRQALSREKEKTLLDEIQTHIHTFDLLYSRFNKESQIIRMSQIAGLYTFPKRDIAFLQLYKDLYDLTNGQFTPLIGQVLADAGYDAEYALKQKKILKVPPTWEEVLQHNFPNIMLRTPYLLDFGAAGKGYLIDLIGELLLEKNIRSFIVDAGGDILEKSDGHTPIKIGLENPLNTKQIIGTVTIQNKSICGSAGNRRKWDRFNHIMNPYTLKSPTTKLAVWVIADSTMLADGLATALYFAEPEVLQKKYRFEYGILDAHFAYTQSSGFPAMLYQVK